MKIIYSAFLIIASLFILCSCNRTNNALIDNNLDNNVVESKDDMKNNNIKIIIDNKEFTGILEENATAKAFISRLPQEFKMNELNGNEKYFYLDYSLPSNAYNPNQIEAGDIMLYGDNCLVIFYKTFKTSYSYMKIGHINNLPNLGNGNINVKFSKMEVN